MAPRVLVLGGTRFVGRALVEHLRGLGYRVDVLNRGVTVATAALPPGVRHLAADRADPAQVRARLARRSYDTVYDTSAYRPAEVTTALAALDGRAGHYVQVSTCVVYAHLWSPGHGHDNARPVPIAEDDTTVAARFDDGDLVAHYAGFKRACETVALDQDRVPVTVLRPCGIYGPHDDCYRHDYFFDRIRAGRPVLVPDTHATRRVHLTSVAGLADACTRAATRTGAAHAVLNVADWDVPDGIGLARACARAAGTPEWVHVYPAAAAAGAAPRARYPFGDEPGFALDISRARAELGWDPPELATGTAVLHTDHARRAASGALPAPDLSLDDTLLGQPELMR